MIERREAIKKFIEERGEVSIGELAASFNNWSEMTLRRDLAYLEQTKAIILTRGGARKMPYRYGLLEDVYSEREQRNSYAKQLIGQRAASLVESGKGIFIDCGTTAMALARNLPDCHLVVITNAPNIALEISMNKEKPSVVLLGGTLSRKEISVVDPALPEHLEKLNIDTAFMAASAFDEKCGFTVGSQLGAAAKQAVMRRAKRVVMLLDSSKAGERLPFTFASVRDVDVLVTDDGIDPEVKNFLQTHIETVI